MIGLTLIGTHFPCSIGLSPGDLQVTEAFGNTFTHDIDLASTVEWQMVLGIDAGPQPNSSPSSAGLVRRHGAEAAGPHR